MLGIISKKKEDKSQNHLLPSVILCSAQVIHSNASLTAHVYILRRHRGGHLSIMSRPQSRQMAGSGLPPAEEVLCFGHRLWRSGGRDGSQSFRRLLASYSAVIVVGRARASAPCSSDNHTLIIAPTTCSASLQGKKAAPVILNIMICFLLANITSCISAFYYEILHNDCKLWGKN